MANARWEGALAQILGSNLESFAALLLDDMDDEERSVLAQADLA